MHAGMMIVLLCKFYDSMGGVTGGEDFATCFEAIAFHLGWVCASKLKISFCSFSTFFLSLSTDALVLFFLFFLFFYFSLMR